MKRNIAELPDLLASPAISALRAHGDERPALHARDAVGSLYARALSDIAYLPSRWVPKLNLPKMDVDETTRGPLYQAIRSQRNVTFAAATSAGQ